MIIKKATAKRWIKKGYAIELGTVIDNNKKYVVVQNNQTQSTHHYEVSK
jgi:hypothetical protein